MIRGANLQRPMEQSSRHMYMYIMGDICTHIYIYIYKYIYIYIYVLVCVCVGEGFLSLYWLVHMFVFQGVSLSARVITLPAPS